MDCTNRSGRFVQYKTYKFCCIREFRQINNYELGSPKLLDLSGTQNACSASVVDCLLYPYRLFRELMVSSLHESFRRRRTVLYGV